MKFIVITFSLLLANYGVARIILEKPGCFSVRGHYSGYSTTTSSAVISVLSGSRSEHKVRISMPKDPGIIKGVKVAAYLNAPRSGDPGTMRFKAKNKNLEILNPKENIVLDTWRKEKTPTRCN